MLRVAAIERLKQIGRLFLPGMRLVGRRCVRQQCERIKHLRFDILPVLRSEIAHGVLVVQRPRAVRNGGSVLIDQAQRVDVLALAFGASPDLLRPLDFLLRNRNCWRARWAAPKAGESTSWRRPNAPSHTADPARPRPEMHFRRRCRRRSEAAPRLVRTAPERPACKKSETILSPISQARWVVMCLLRRRERNDEQHGRAIFAIGGAPRISIGEGRASAVSAFYIEGCEECLGVGRGLVSPFAPSEGAKDRPSRFVLDGRQKTHPGSTIQGGAPGKSSVFIYFAVLSAGTGSGSGQTRDTSQPPRDRPHSRTALQSSGIRRPADL